MKDFLESFNDLLSLLLISIGIGTTIYGVAAFGITTIILIAICLCILYMGSSMTFKRIIKYEKDEQNRQNKANQAGFH